jgi:hypothetical protein
MSEVSTAQAGKAPIRPPAEIEADLVATRERLVGTIAELEDRVKPANVVNRGKSKVQAFYTDDRNNVRWDRVAMTAGGVIAGLIGVRMVSRTVRWALAVPKDKPVDADVVYLPIPKSQVGTLAGLIG